MKTIAYILLFCGLGLVGWWWWKKRSAIKPLGTTYEQRLATVVEVIYRTPSWLKYVTDHANKKGEPLQVPLMHSARHDLDRRGVEEIIANPENFIRCFG